MNEAVADILSERAQISDGISVMVVLSLVAHGILARRCVRARVLDVRHRQKSTPMMITLGGAEGPDAGGLTTIAARPVQRVAEPDEKPARRRPRREKAPEMVAPTRRRSRSRRRRPSRIEKPTRTVVDARSRRAGRDQSGAAKADTGGAQVPFGGLTTGGGGTGGARVNRRRTSAVPRTWRRSSDQSSATGTRARCDGTEHREVRDPCATARIDGIEVDQSAGQLLDLASETRAADDETSDPAAPGVHRRHADGPPRISSITR